MAEGRVQEFDGRRRQKKTCHEEIVEMGIEDGARAPRSDTPSGVLEKIVCGIPFPQAFKARLLNKEWYSKFPDVINTNQASSTWPTYCPAFLSPGEILGFDRCSNSWHKMSFKALQKGVSFSLPEGKVVHFDRQTLEGALLCTVEGFGDGGTATVVNLLSGKSRVITCPRFVGEFAHPPILKLVGAESFQILIRSLARDWRARDTLEIAVYSSWSDSWVQRSHAIKYCLDHGIYLDHVYDVQMSHASHAYLEGTMFWCEGVMDDRLNIDFVRVFLEDESNVDTFTTLEDLEADLKLEDDECLQDFTDPLIEFAPDDKKFLKDFNICALRCGTRTILVLVLYYKFSSGIEWSARVKLYHFDRKEPDFSFSLIELSAEAPSSMFVGLTEQKLVFLADKDYVYICGENLTSYNVESNTWTSHGPIPAAAYWHPKSLKHCVKFQPGLNPFVVP